MISDNILHEKWNQWMHNQYLKFYIILYLMISNLILNLAIWNSHKFKSYKLLSHNLRSYDFIPHNFISLKVQTIQFCKVIFIRIIRHLIALLTFERFQIQQMPRMFPVWDFVVGIFVQKVVLHFGWVLTILSCQYLYSK